MTVESVEIGLVVENEALGVAGRWHKFELASTVQ